MKRILRRAMQLGVLVLVLVASEAIPGMNNLNRFMTLHEPALLIWSISLAALGFVLLMGGALSFAMGGQQMSHSEVEDLSRRRFNDSNMLPTVLWRESAYRIAGFTVGFQGEDQASFEEVKRAWRTGAWLREPRWRRNFVMGAGGILVFFGGFSTVFVLGPSYIRIVAAGVVAYALVRMVWAFARA